MGITARSIEMIPQSRVDVQVYELPVHLDIPHIVSSRYLVKPQVYTVYVAGLTLLVLLEPKSARLTPAWSTVWVVGSTRVQIELAKPKYRKPWFLGWGRRVLKLADTDHYHLAQVNLWAEHWRFQQSSIQRTYPADIQALVLALELQDPRFLGPLKASLNEYYAGKEEVYAF